MPNASLTMMGIGCSVWRIQCEHGSRVASGDPSRRGSHDPALTNITDGHNLITILTSIFMHTGWSHRRNCHRSIEISVNPGSTIPSLGASGAIAAVMGAFLVTYPHHRIKVLHLFGWFVRPVSGVWWNRTPAASPTLRTLVKCSSALLPPVGSKPHDGSRIVRGPSGHGRTSKEGCIRIEDPENHRANWHWPRWRPLLFFTGPGHRSRIGDVWRPRIDTTVLPGPWKRWLPTVRPKQLGFHREQLGRHFVMTADVAGLERSRVRRPHTSLHHRWDDAPLPGLCGTCAWW